MIDDTAECERPWDGYVERRLSSNDDKGHSFRAGAGAMPKPRMATRPKRVVQAEAS